MKHFEMTILCEKLSISVESIIGKQATHIVRRIMFTLHPELHGCNDTMYTYIFMRAAALAKNAIDIKNTETPIDTIYDNEELELYTTISNEMKKVH